MSFIEKGRRLLVHPRLPLVVALLAFALTLPSLGFGFIVDDQLHAFYLQGGDVPGGPRGVWDLYRFADGGEGTLRAIGKGEFPWWTSPALRFGFFRPLSSLWITADHLVFGPVVAHFASCLAYALLAYVVAKLLARIVPGAAGGLAAVLFAVDDGHHMTVLWVANRHALTSALLGVTAIWLHLRRREEGRGSIWLPAVSLALAFAAGESALGLWPYLFGYALWLDPGGRRAGLRALAPFGAVTALWAVAFVAGGYGTAGSGFYVDPVGQPLAFAGRVAVRLPVLLAAQLTGFPADVVPLLPLEAQPVVLAAAIGVVVLAAGVLFRLTRHHRAAPMLATGLVLGLVPCCATFPSDRLLLLAGPGAFGLLGIAIARAARALVDRRRMIPATTFIAGTLFFHLLVATPLLPLRTRSTAGTFSEAIQRGNASLPSDPALRDQILVVIETPDALMTTYMFLDRAVAGGVTPRTAHLLSVAQRGNVTLTRVSERDFDLRADAPLNADVFDLLYRSTAYRAGERYPAGPIEVTVTEVDGDGWPLALRIQFRELDPAKQRWVAWRHRGFVEEPVLAVGASTTIPATSWTEAMGM